MGFCESSNYFDYRTCVCQGVVVIIETTSKGIDHER
ncbi:Uncharacterised protein [Mycobacteroides abscessus subsp. abscessus]|nr:Uncharacterised protein [Mycobacteroides abscessus subsp. abscessus]